MKEVQIRNDIGRKIGNSNIQKRSEYKTMIYQYFRRVKLAIINTERGD